jgi:hypothetical protein
VPVSCEKCNEPSGSIKGGEFLEKPKDNRLYGVSHL